MNPDLAASKALDSLRVFRGVDPVGTLSRTEHGASFAYDQKYREQHAQDPMKAIAFKLPVRELPFVVNGTNLHPFFAGLLPEGLRLHALVRGVKTSEDDLFSLLAAVGSNTVGDVWVQASGNQSVIIEPVVELTKLGKTSFDELLAQSLDWNKGGDLVTVAGVQPKVSAAMISIPMRPKSQRHEYLLKLSPNEFPRLVENEFFFMQLAKSMKLRTAPVKLVHDREGRAGLLVERFDRVPTLSKSATTLDRVHQEDACQLTDRYPADKYRISLREVADALEVCSAPLVERLRLLQLQALSYLIGNGDMHAKNISVQVHERRVQLTPIYDLVTTLPYGDEHMALQMDGRDKALRRKDFLEFGERIGVRQAATERMLDHLIKKVGPIVVRLSEIGFDTKKTSRLEREVGERAKRLAT